MLSLIWHWITGWVIGWGGIGALVSIIAWALWWFEPAFLGKLKGATLHVAIGATVFTLASTYFYTSGYNRGYSVAINEVAAADEAAVQRVKTGAADVKACRIDGGTWDVTTGSCTK